MVTVVAQGVCHTHVILRIIYIYIYQKELLIMLALVCKVSAFYSIWSLLTYFTGTTPYNI